MRARMLILPSQTTPYVILPDIPPLLSPKGKEPPSFPRGGEGVRDRARSGGSSFSETNGRWGGNGVNAEEPTDDSDFVFTPNT